MTIPYTISSGVDTSLSTKLNTNFTYLHPVPALIYGSGADGPTTMSVDTTISTHKEYSNLTINNGVVVTVANGYSIRVSDTLTNNGTLQAAAGYSGGSGGDFLGSGVGDGGSGGAGGGWISVFANKIAGSGTIKANGTNGSNGGDASGTASGNDGAQNGVDGSRGQVDGSLITNSDGKNTGMAGVAYSNKDYSRIVGKTLYSTATSAGAGGGGGRSGNQRIATGGLAGGYGAGGGGLIAAGGTGGTPAGSATGTGRGGGGGGGGGAGGIVVFFAGNKSGTPFQTLQALGGNGGNGGYSSVETGSCDNATGGGGGGGGLIVVGAPAGTYSTNVAGGSAGAIGTGGSGGESATAGSSGVVMTV